MLAKDILEKNPEYIGIIPAECWFCGHYLELNDTMSSIHCVNPLCTGFLGNRLSSMANVLGVKGFGEAVCDNIVEEHKLTNMHGIFDVPADKLTSLYLPGNNRKLSEALTRGLQNVPLDKAVESMALVGIRSLAAKIFKGYSGIDEFYEDFHQDSCFLLRKLGKEHLCTEYTDSNYKVQIPRLRVTLETCETEIRTFISYFTLKVIPKQTLDIVITGEIDGYKNKDLYVESLNNSCDTFIVLKKTVTKDISYVICNGAKTSGKARKALGYGIPVLTSNEFENILLGK